MTCVMTGYAEMRRIATFSNCLEGEVQLQAGYIKLVACGAADSEPARVSLQTVRICY